MNNTKKTLVLMNARHTISRYYLDNAKIRDVELKSTYNLYKKNLIYSFAALWMEILDIPWQSCWYGNWKYQIENYDTVIVFAHNLSWRILDFIKRKNPNARIIVWYWDSVSKKNYLEKKYVDMCELWSFDPQDCIKYGFKKNIQFYIKSKSFDYDKNIQYDAMFVGSDKGRNAQLCDIESKLIDAGFNIYMYILKDKTSKNKNKSIHKNDMEYSQIVNIIEKSNCIIDIPKENQSGLTLRVLESIFYSKKLITTHKEIINEEFYNPNNILVWDNPTEEKILEFFNSPYETVSDEICEKYTIERWIKNFGTDRI